MSYTTIAETLLRGGLVTLKVAAGAWIVATVLGLVLAVAREIGSRTVDAIVIAFVTLLRSIPQLVALYLVYFGLGEYYSVDPILAAIVTLGVTDGAYTAEYFRAGFKTIHPGQYDAGRSLGLGALAILRIVVLPQVVPFSMPPLLNLFISLLKTAVLASAVGVPEVLYRAQDIMTGQGIILPVVITLVLLYVVVTLPLTAAIRPLEARIQRRVREYANA